MRLSPVRAVPGEAGSGLGAGPAEPQLSSVVALVRCGHVVQVAAVLVAAVVQGLGLEEGGGRRQVGGRGGHGQVVVVVLVVAVRRLGVLRLAGQVGLVGVVVGGAGVQLHVGEGVSQGRRRCGNQAQRRRGGGWRGGRGAGPRREGGGGGGRGGGGGGGGVEDADGHAAGAAGLQQHGAGHPEALLLVRLEHVGEAEALAAHLTRVRLLAGVRAAVALHVGSAGEALPADLANEGFLSCVVEK